jgi:cytochrome c
MKVHPIVIAFIISCTGHTSFANPSLASAKNCFACHSVENKIVGPAYKDVAEKYRADPQSVDYLTQKILNGSSGVWGDLEMPKNTQVSKAEAKKLATWILNLK